MKKGAFLKNLEYGEKKVNISVVLETSFSKEIRIIFKEGQLMKEHKAPHPIVVQVIKGTIDFGVNDKSHILEEGDIITLDARVPHDLLAKKESVVRLSLSKQDSVNRVNKIG